MLKPYFVELKVTAVVMAGSQLEAMGVAEDYSSQIFRVGGDPFADDAIELKSLEQLERLDPYWDGMCIPYGGDGDTRLQNLLPETEPFKDTKTVDMFESKQDQENETLAELIK